VISFIDRHRAVLALLSLGLAARFVLAFVLFPMQGYTGDLGLFWSWAQSLAAHGPTTFYASTSSANYPPGYLYVLWALGAIGNPALLKVPPMLADIAIGAMVYALASRWRGQRAGLVAATLFLFLPVSWYDSALWGQVDAVGTALALGALVLLLDGWSEAALTTAVLAVLVKPQYAIVLAVVVPVLVRRHLVRAGSGPRPRMGRLAQRLDRALGGLLSDQGPRRLASSGIVAALVGLLVILPFDLVTYAPASLADVPVISSIAGLIGLFGRLGNEFTVLTANAYNPWSLVGSPSLATVAATGSGNWIADSLPVLGGIPAVVLGGAILAGVGLLVVVGLLLRDGTVPILLGFTLLALAFFVAPTRVHERYLFPFFAAGAVLAAPTIASGLGYAAAALLNTANLHAVLTGSLHASSGGASGFGGGAGGFGGRGPGGFGGAGAFGGFGGTFSSISLPFGDVAASQAVVTASALGLGITLVLLVGAWVAVIAGVRRAQPEPGTMAAWPDPSPLPR
jgi:hypothetical protein